MSFSPPSVPDPTPPTSLPPSQPSISPLSIAISVTVAILLLLILCIGTYHFRRQRDKQRIEQMYQLPPLQGCRIDHLLSHRQGYGDRAARIDTPNGIAFEAWLDAVAKSDGRQRGSVEKPVKRWRGRIWKGSYRGNGKEKQKSEQGVSAMMEAVGDADDGSLSSCTILRGSGIDTGDISQAIRLGVVMKEDGDAVPHYLNSHRSSKVSSYISTLPETGCRLEGRILIEAASIPLPPSDEL